MLVNRCCCVPAGVTCGSCTMPAKNLVLSWTTVAGTFDGTTAFIFNATNGSWSATITTGSGAGTVQLHPCAGVVNPFSVTVGGSTCSSSNATPSALVFTTFSCSPVLRIYEVRSVNCPSLYGIGLRTLTVTE